MKIYIIVGNEPVSEKYASTWAVEAFNNKHVAEVSFSALRVLLEALNDLLLSKYQDWELEEVMFDIMKVDPQFPGLNEDEVCLVSYDLHTVELTEDITIH
jgi:hypothetical protein